MRIRTAVAASFVIASAALGQDADLVLRHGVVATVDDAIGTVEAIAVRGETILAVGSNDDIARHIGDDTQVIDLNGRLAIPGFIEGHAHFIGLGQSKMNLDLMAVSSWDEVIRMVEEAVAAASPGEWIVGRGWHQEKWDQRPAETVEGFPTHHDLSAISPDNPVFLMHASGHASFANKAAMDLAAVSGATVAPAGGDILLDEAGQPTGIFREKATGLIGSVYAEAEGRTSRRRRMANLDRAIDLAVEECLKHGVTSFQDAGTSFPDVQHLAARARADQLGVRLWMMIREPTDLVAEYIAGAKHRRVGPSRFTVGGLKRSLDGALGARGAWLLEPYTDSPSSVGLATATLEDCEALGRIALAHDLQLCVHAIGDRANRELLDLYERMFAEMNDGKDRRWRIEHAQHLHPDDIGRFAELGVIAAMQGVHCTSDGPWVPQRLGEERSREGAYVWRSLLDSGAIIANGTDAPVESIDPIASYHASVTRRMKNGERFYPEQSMTRMEALRSYTLHAAHAAFEEDIKGSLTPGKLADIVVLSQNILACDADVIPATKVDVTIVGGRVAYQR